MPYHGIGTIDPVALRHLIDGTGLSLKISISPSAFVIEFHGPANAAETAAGLLVDMVLAPRFDDSVLAERKREQANHLRAAQADPMVHFEAIAPGLMYGPDTAEARDPGGTVATIAALTVDALLGHHRRLFDPAGAMLFTAGTAETLQLLGDRLERGAELFQWFFPTKSFHAMTGKPGGVVNADDVFAAKSMEDFGAFIIGRNMFGPVRGAWPDNGWKGWWGDDPPFHAPTFVLTHHERDSLVMEGGTTFHFVTGGIHEALRMAKEIAGGKDVKIGGGASVVRQYLQAGLIDAMHLAFAPTLLGQGEAPLAGIDLRGLGFSVANHTGTENAMHILLQRSPTGKELDSEA